MYYLAVRFFGLLTSFICSFNTAVCGFIPHAVHMVAQQCRQHSNATVKSVGWKCSRTSRSPVVLLCSCWAINEHDNERPQCTSSHVKTVHTVWGRVYFSAFPACVCVCVFAVLCLAVLLTWPERCKASGESGKRAMWFLQLSVVSMCEASG